MAMARGSVVPRVRRAAIVTATMTTVLNSVGVPGLLVAVLVQMATAHPAVADSSNATAAAAHPRATEMVMTMTVDHHAAIAQKTIMALKRTTP